MKTFHALLFAAFINIIILPFSNARQLDFFVNNGKMNMPVYGQIDWPKGEIGGFSGQVILLISAGGPVDRDGWLLRALDSVWWNRLPMKDISTALVKKGFAVARFDSPGVYPPAKKCRESAMQEKINAELVSTKCVNIGVLKKISVPKYVDSLENVLKHLEKIAPHAQKGFILFGFSEGFWHALSIVERGSVAVGGVISLGAGVESLQSITQWQLTDRAIEVLPKFDRNADGEVSNEEIIKGYSEGLGGFASDVRDWLSPTGFWNKENFSKFARWVRGGYEDIYQKSGSYEEPGSLHWKALRNGVFVPDINDSIQNYHIRDSILPLDILIQKRTPGFFIWGGKDSQVRVQYQREIINNAQAKIPDVRFHIYPDRHHLLSRRKDFDWFEPEFADEISQRIDAFIKNIPTPHIK